MTGHTRHVVDGANYQPAPADTRIVTITRSERDVLAELALDGASNTEIGDRLGVAEDTVKTHIKHLLRKTGAPTRTALVAGVLRRRIRVTVVDHRAQKTAA